MKKNEKRHLHKARYLFFFLGDERFGISIAHIKEIVRFTECTPLPRAPSYMLGMLNLRGSNIPVIDLAGWLGFRNQLDSEHQAVVILKVDAREIGLLVDRVDEVGSVGDELMPTKTLESLKESMTEGIARDSHLDEAVILLRAEALLSELSLNEKTS
ncbi:MAG: chemotaxis protein CheW [Wolinella sp.]